MAIKKSDTRSVFCYVEYKHLKVIGAAAVAASTAQSIQKPKENFLRLGFPAFYAIL